MNNLSFKQEPHPLSVDTRVCEICGRRFITGYGYSIAGCWLVTGSCAVSSHMCQHPDASGNQHWGCTPEHAMEALMICLQHDEHLSIAHLRAMHQEHIDRGVPLVSQEDEWMLKAFPHFPFTE